MQDQPLIGPIKDLLKLQHPHLRTPQPHPPRAPEQDDPPNLINSGAREEHDLNPWCTGQIPPKAKAPQAQLNQRVEAATCNYIETANSLKFILCLWLRIIRGV